MDDYVLVNGTDPVIIDILGNDSDPDGDSLSIFEIESFSSSNGEIAINPDGTITFTPGSFFDLELDYLVQDPGGHMARGVLVIESNRVPFVRSDTATVDDGETVVIDVLSNDFDSQPLTVSNVTMPSFGTATITVDNKVEYTANAGFGGTDTFDYTADDGVGGTATATVTVTVDGSPNTPPVAVDDLAFVPADQASGLAASSILADDSDADGDPLTIIAVGPAANGTTSLPNETAVFYTPDPGFSGQDSFTYTISDGHGGTDTATISVTVTPANAPPDAVDDSGSVDEDGVTITISVLGNDSDAEGDAFSVTGNTAAANGTVTDNGSGNFSYAPDENFNGADTFTYTITDTPGGTDTATVSITVNPVNDDPVAVDDAVTLDEDGEVTIIVTDNDIDADGDVLEISIVSGAANGGIGFNSTAAFVSYGPDENFNGTDTVVYSVSDGNGGTDTATITFTVNPVNDAPTSSNDTVFGSLDEPRDYEAATLLANDGDADGDVLTITAVSNAVNGAAVLNGTTITFTPDTGVIGDAFFRYTVDDGNGATAQADVVVEVVEGNSPPIADATRAVTTLTDTALVFDITASDPDGDALSFSASDPANGSVSLDGNRVTYTRSDGSTGTDTITVTIDDGNGGTTTQEITFTTQNLPLSDQFVMFAADGFTGGAGGSGAINGTDGFQQIAVIDTPGAIALDPSFNRGGDILQLSGDASAWSVTRSGSSALFSDGDTFVTVPVGTAGLAVQFDDGVRELIFDGSSFAIGGQAFASGILTPIDAAPDGTSLPPGADPAAKAVLFIAADAEVAASGVVDIFGAAGNELASLISGNLTLDASFNRGGDTIAFDEVATDYLANQSGSSVRLTGSDTTALIPVGTSGATLAFGGGSDTRTVLFDTGIPAITIGGQQIGLDPVQLAAA